MKQDEIKNQEDELQGDLAIRLFEALKKKGIRVGVTVLTSQQREKWKDLSPKQLVEAAINEFNLTEKNRILNILQKIYEDTQKPVHTFQLRKEVEKYRPTTDKQGNKDAGLSINEYMYAFQQWEKLDVVGGSSAQRKYLWKPKEKPLFSDAETVYNFVQELKKYSVHPKSKDYVKDNFHKSFEEIDAVLNPDRNVLLTYRLRVLYHQQKALERKRNEKKPPVTFDVELSRKAPELKEEEKKEDEVKVDDKVMDVALQTKEEPKSSEDSLVSILEKRAKYYKKLLKLKEEECKKKLKAKDDYIKSLEKALSKQKVAISDTSGSMQ